MLAVQDAHVFSGSCDFRKVFPPSGYGYETIKSENDNTRPQ